MTSASQPTVITYAIPFAQRPLCSVAADGGKLPCVAGTNIDNGSRTGLDVYSRSPTNGATCAAWIRYLAIGI